LVAIAYDVVVGASRGEHESEVVAAAIQKIAKDRGLYTRGYTAGPEPTAPKAHVKVG
jgi:hypothetical protein